MTDTFDSADQPALWDPPSMTGTTRRTGRGQRTAGRRPDLSPKRRPSPPTDVRELWGIEEVAAYLRVPRQTIYSWRQSGYGPRGMRVGKHLRWRASVVIEWTLAQERDD